MREGRVTEIVDVPLPHPRRDLAAIRGTAEFAATRYRIWRGVHALPDTVH